MIVWSEIGLSVAGDALGLDASSVRTGGALRGALILALFGLGEAIPLVGAAYLSRAGFGQVRAWVIEHGEQSKKFFGAMLLVLGWAILTGGDRWLEAQVSDWLPNAWLELTTRF